jgi:hypothetical protein
MSRERRNAPGSEASPGERVRRRLHAEPELELSEEELRALADEGIDPDEVRRLSRERPEDLEASDHDRDTARDALEGMARANEDDH